MGKQVLSSIVLTIILFSMSCSMTGPRTASALIGPVWEWAYTIQHKDGTKIRPPDPKKYTVQFLEPNKLELKADCNLKGGTYSVTEGLLSIKVTYSTRVACGEGSLEDQFVRYLTDGATFLLRDGDLVIVLKENSSSMQFFRQ
jgi:heat shock protein HslJ